MTEAIRRTEPNATQSSTSTTTAGPASAGRGLVITRIIDTPRALVFKAWTDPKHVARWWGPHGFTNPVCELDVRSGGIIRIHMRGPDGTLYPMTGVYHEIVEPERLVFISAALDEEGNPLFEVLNTVTMAERGGKTTLAVQARVAKSTAEAAPVSRGDGSRLDAEPGTPRGVCGGPKRRRSRITSSQPGDESSCSRRSS